MSTTKETKKVYTIPGIVYYAQVHRPSNPKKANIESKYTLDLVVTDKEVSTHLKALGVLPSKKKLTDENGLTNEVLKEFPEHPGMPVYTVSQRATINGDPSKPPFVRDIDGIAVPSTEAIGNGSKVLVSAHTYPDSIRKGVHYLGLRGVTVLDLVPYESNVEEVTLGGGDVTSTYKSPLVNSDSPFDTEEIDIPYGE